MENETVEPTPKDRGGEQGDVEGPSQCSLALGMVATEARLHIAGQQTAGIVHWVGASSDDELRRFKINIRVACPARKRRPSRLLVPR